MAVTDTVIECSCEDRGLGCINCDYGAAFEQGCEAQAPISFKAGYEKLKGEYDEDMRTHYKAGIKEVVECLKSIKIEIGDAIDKGRGDTWHTNLYVAYGIEAILKERGIK